MAEDNILKLNQCKTCGGELVLIGDTYYCQYCENAYKAQNTQDTEGRTQITAAKATTKLSENSGVDVFEDNIDGVIEITTAPNDLGAVRDALDGKYTLASAEVSMVPQTMTELTDEAQIAQMQKMLDMLEDNDDVQNVYHNWDMPDEE